MEVTHRAAQGERLDQICQRFYGYHDGGIVDRVMDLNMVIANLGPILPMGTIVRLPILTRRTPEVRMIQLWD